MRKCCPYPSKDNYFSKYGPISSLASASLLEGIRLKALENLFPQGAALNQWLMGGSWINMPAPSPRGWDNCGMCPTQSPRGTYWDWAPVTHSRTCSGMHPVFPPSLPCLTSLLPSASWDHFKSLPMLLLSSKTFCGSYHLEGIHQIPCPPQFPLLPLQSIYSPNTAWALP